MLKADKEKMPNTITVSGSILIGMSLIGLRITFPISEKKNTKTK